MSGKLVVILAACLVQFGCEAIKDATRGPRLHGTDKLIYRNAAAEIVDPALGEDLPDMERSAALTLDTYPAMRIGWRNTETGRTGYAIAGDSRIIRRLYCRDFTLVTKMSGQIVMAHGEACRGVGDDFWMLFRAQ